MVKNIIFLKKISFSDSTKKDLFHSNLLGKTQRQFLKQRVAINVNHPFGGLKKQLFTKLQKHFKMQPNYVNQNKLKEDSLLKTRKKMNYKNTRIQKNLPLRGQRTHTNAKTRKKRKIL